MAMRFGKVGLSVLVCLLVIFSTSLGSRLPMVFAESRVLAQTLDTGEAEADRLLQEGVRQLQDNQLEAALKSFQKALTIYQNIKNRKGEGITLASLGFVYYGLRNYPQAIDSYKQFLAIAREIKDSKLEALEGIVQQGLADAQLRNNPRKAEADRLFQQGVEQFQTSQFTAALQFWEQALKIYQEIQDRQGEGNALGGLGIAYDSLGDYPKAINYHQQSLTIARKIKDRKGEGTALGNFGITYRKLGNYPKAINYHQQYLTIAREIKDRRGEGTALGNLGIAYNSLGEHSKAIDYYQQYLAIAREIKDRRGEGQSLGNLGIAYDSLGEYSKAIDYLQQSLTIAREIKDRRGEGTALGNLGNTYDSLGEYSKAIDYLQQSLAIAREIKDRRGEGQSLGNLGIAYHVLGDYPKAIDYLQQSLVIAREIKNHEGEGNALGGLGIAYDSLGEYSKAIDYLQQSLAIAREIKDRKGEGVALGNLGATYHVLGDYPKAIDYFQQRLAIAREIKDRRGEGQSLGNLGIAYHVLGDYPKAIDYHQQSLAMLREIKDRKGEGRSLGNLGIAYDSLGEYSKAIDYFQRRLAIAREIKDRKGEGNALRNLGNVYHVLGDYPKAIDDLQQSLKSAREIKDRYGEGTALNNLGFVYYKQGKLTLAESILIEGMKVRESLRGRELKDNEKILFFDTQRNIYPTLQQVLIAQNKTDAAIEISERGRARAFVELLSSRFSPNPLEQSPKPLNVEEIRQIAKAQNSTLVQYSIIDNNFKIAGKEETKESELYIWVIKPTGEIIFHKTDLKPLWKKENTTLTKLIDNTRDSMGVIDIITRHGGLKPAKTAVVAKMFQAKYIHLATHGLFDDIRGLGSAIALAPSNQDDGLLTAEEIFNFQEKFNQKLKADLVVLSACDTGRGRITGDGVIGLSRSFISAGVPSVIVSLWSVDDASTAFLMTKFYQNLERNPDKAKALREAMLETKKQYSQPLQWAAFTLIGESE
jgi:tetratricopeptide (TPR) repeat protein